MANKRLKRAAKEAAAETNKKSKMKVAVLISVVLLAVMFFVLCAMIVVNSYAPYNPKRYHKWFLSAMHGSYDKEGLPSTYFQVEDYENGEPTFIKLETKREGKYVAAIYANLSDLKENEVKFSVYNGSKSAVTQNTSLGNFDLKGEDLKDSEDGWIKIYDAKNSTVKDTDVSSKTFYVSINKRIRVRELVLLDGDGKVMNYTVKGYVLGNKTFDESETEVKDKAVSVYKIADEQQTYPNYIADTTM